MEFQLGQRLKHAWNAFQERGPFYPRDTGPSYSMRPDRSMLTRGNERSIVASIYTRIGVDASAVPMSHVRLDQNGSYIETINSGLNACLNVEANIDQTGRSFIQDVVMSMCDEGVVAIVPIDTTVRPSDGSFDITSMRTGKILEWMPYHVRVNVYNERTGYREDIVVEKRNIAIIENPLFAVMNEPNSTLQRLINKLNLLDISDDKISKGKLDLIVKVPYAVKSPARIEQANQRRQDIENQLTGGAYGVAYIDATENVTQLNRPVENNLMAQIPFLTQMLYGQLGITEEILNGTADESVTLNFHARTIEPILSAIAGEMTRKFITKTGRTQGQAIRHYRNPFALATLSTLADAGDKFTRNEILTSNEVRGAMGVKPSKEKGADELRNKNLNPGGETPVPQPAQNIKEEGSNTNNGQSKSSNG